MGGATGAGATRGPAGALREGAEGRADTSADS